MQTDKAKGTILDYLITEEDRRDILSLLSDVEENLFKTDDSLKNVIGSNARFGRILTEFLPPDWQSPESSETIGSMIMGIKNEIVAIPTVNVVLAIMANEKILSMLESFARDELGKKVLFKIDVNPDIIGGAIFIIDGNYLDFSLLRKLNEAAIQKRDQINALIG
ncbi:MAG TPA: F0F1 ATP synthase subunit delta [Patescibacteria group bacterium]|nr:F0F1 ATP synthase subunit delta [Patescibacteria group bacterium]